MIIKCTEEEKKYILTKKCPYDIADINIRVCFNPTSWKCKKCFAKYGIKFEIVEVENVN